MSLLRRSWGAALCFVVLSSGALWASCALPGYTLGDVGSSGAGGSGQAASGAGGGSTVGAGGASTASNGAGGEVSGAGGTGTMASTGTDGVGGSANIDCTSDDICLGHSTTCLISYCDKSGSKGVCAFKDRFDDSSTNVKPNAAPDCKTVVCESGLPKEVAAAEEVEDDGDPCTQDGCSNTMVVHQVKDGLPCAFTAGVQGKCLNDRCVQCVANIECGANPQGLCSANKCVPTTCGNGSKSEMETDTDCGGPDCAPCPEGKACVEGSECDSGSCVQLVCMPAKCGDGVKNGPETDKDCGGLDPTCPRCDIGQVCKLHKDCASGLCRSGKCQQASCEDWVKDNGETGIDCGLVCGISCP